eukprot:1180425-Pyramimonas_sp.AAC.1
MLARVGGQRAVCCGVRVLSGVKASSRSCLISQKTESSVPAVNFIFTELIIMRLPFKRRVPIASKRLSISLG